LGSQQLTTKVIRIAPGTTLDLQSALKADRWVADPGDFGVVTLEGPYGFEPLQVPDFPTVTLNGGTFYVGDAEAVRTRIFGVAFRGTGAVLGWGSLELPAFDVRAATLQVWGEVLWASGESVNLQVEPGGYFQGSERKPLQINRIVGGGDGA